MQPLRCPAVLFAYLPPEFHAVGSFILCRQITKRVAENCNISLDVRGPSLSVLLLFSRTPWISSRIILCPSSNAEQLGSARPIQYHHQCNQRWSLQGLLQSGTRTCQSSPQPSHQPARNRIPALRFRLKRSRNVPACQRGVQAAEIRQNHLHPAHRNQQRQRTKNTR